jgi:glyoxylase I family protein
MNRGTTHLGQGFHHVAIRARDFDRSVAFYTEVLGCTVKLAWGAAPKRATMLDCGNGGYMEIFERPDEAPPAADDAVILHFAFRVDDTDAALEAARAAGCEVTMAPRDFDIETTNDQGVVKVHIAFCKGPDGELIEFFENEVT